MMVTRHGSTFCFFRGKMQLFEQEKPDALHVLQLALQLAALAWGVALLCCAGGCGRLRRRHRSAMHDAHEWLDTQHASTRQMQQRNAYAKGG